MIYREKVTGMYRFLRKDTAFTAVSLSFSHLMTIKVNGLRIKAPYEVTGD